MKKKIELYVAPGGNDCGPGTKRQPLATLAHARDVLRAMGAKRGEATVWLRGGRHVLRRPFVLSKEDSNVVYAAVPGEEVIIDGGEEVTGWREVERNGRREFVTQVKRYGRQLFVNGERRPRARLPKVGRAPGQREFYRIADVPGGKVEGFNLFEHYDTFIAAPGQFENWTNLRDVEVVAVHFWIEERMPVRGYDPRTRRVTTRLKSIFPLTEDWSGKWARYYVDNVFEALTEPGEWYLERKTGTLHYLPMPGETVQNIRAYMPRIEQLVKVYGGAENIVFKGITFEHTEWEHRGGRRANVNDPVPSKARFGGYGQGAWGVAAAVSLENARQCAFEGCTFRHFGGYAIEIEKGSRENRVTGCELYDLGAGGIRVNGPRANEPPARHTGLNIITDNHIYDAGHVYHSGVGILAMHTFGNEIARNHIHDLLYTGITCGWVWGFDANVARDNRIEGNHIHDLGHGWLSDMGGIYTLGVQPGTVIRENHIHDIFAHQYGGWGVYLDEGSSHIVVEKNVVHDCGSTALNVHFGRENIIRNNIFAYGGEGVAGLGRATAYNAFTLERNILITDGAPVYLGGYGWDVRERGIVTDLNVLWDVRGGGALVVAANARHKNDGVAMGFAEWQASGQDEHSVVADPGCADIAGRDFRLREDSPARGRGVDLRFTIYDLRCKKQSWGGRG